MGLNSHGSNVQSIIMLYFFLSITKMPVCEMCSNDSDKCYKVYLTITSNFNNKDEEAPFKRNSIICSV